MKMNFARSKGSEHLSVIHKASLSGNFQLLSGKDPVLQTDLEFNITGWNAAAAELHGQPGALGKNLFKLVDIYFMDGDQATLKHQIKTRGFWTGEVLFKRFDDQQMHFGITATSITAGAESLAILIVCRSIQSTNSQEKQLDAILKKHEILLNTLPQGIMTVNRDATVETCNQRGADILGLGENEIVGMSLTGSKWKAFKVDGSVFPFTEFPAVVSLQTGFPQRNVIMGIERRDRSRVWLSVNSEALLQPGKFEPYGAVVSFVDITDSKKTEEDLRNSNERFYHVSRVTSDAIWDIDLISKQIYRSGNFKRLSGYSAEQIESSPTWWFTKIHPEDRDRVETKLNEHIQTSQERWEDEYRFQCADQSFKCLHDSGIILYKGGRPVRMLGAIRDLTEQKRLEKQLMDEQIQRHKEITQASIAAQELEKSYISRELHDNVNQILMSAKLFMDTARRMPEQTDELLQKAIEYQLLALQEIRKLSKSLSTENVKNIGLKQSIEDIVDNFELLGIDVDLIFNERVEQKLSDDQKLMLFRIVQEQTSNIIKYASSKSVQIMVNESNDVARLVIADDGVGFDMAEKGTKGIGFLNIISRADVYNGKVNIVSSPGNGCTVEICFPVI